MGAHCTSAAGTLPELPRYLESGCFAVRQRMGEAAAERVCRAPFTYRLILVEYAPMLVPRARVAELVDAVDSKSIGREVVRVQVSPRAPLPFQGPLAGS